MLTADEVARLLGASRTLVYKLMKQHGFPKAIKIGTATRWDEKEVMTWIKARKEARGS